MDSHDFAVIRPEDEDRDVKSESPLGQKTIGLLGASFGTKNLGVAALTSGTIASVFHSYPNARLFLVDYAIEPATYDVSYPGGAATVEMINIRFSKRFYLRNNIARLLFIAFLIRLLPSSRLRGWFLLRNHVLKTIHEADIIGSISGGDSFSDIYGLRRFIYMALPQVLVLVLGKPLVLLPQTLGPFKGGFAKAVARYILRGSRMVYARDALSLEKIRGIAGRDQGRIAFSYDMGFALEPKIRRERMPSWLAEYDGSVPLVGLNVSGLLYIGGYTRNNMFGIKGEYRRLIHDLIDHFIRKRSVRVMLVPHVFGTEKGSESDAIACREIYEGTENDLRGKLYCLEKDYDQHEIKALIGHCDFFLGSRMHACIGALSQFVPAVGLAYSPKFHGVFKSIGMEELVIDLRDCNENGIVAAVDRAYQRRIELRAMLEAIIPAVQASVLDLFSRFSIGLER